MLLNNLLRSGDKSTFHSIEKLAKEIDMMGDDYGALTDGELRHKTVDFKTMLDNGATMAHIMPQAFATAREASKRVLGLYHYPVQIMGGAALYSGSIAEMGTGEGKTLTCVLPAYTRALEGKGTHIVTVNDYLAQRDADLMGRIYRWLGLTVGTITSTSKPDERKQAYRADITYGTNNEYGFDYLRDNMAKVVNDCVTRGHYHYAIIDEVDSILIDEARTPLIISGSGEESTVWYEEFARIAEYCLTPDMYSVDKRKHTVSVEPEAIATVERQIGIKNLYAPENTYLVRYMMNALKAKELFTLDKDYMIGEPDGDDSILIIDEFTGRSLPGRRFNEGLHQAIEAKEHVRIHPESTTLATVTYQNFFRQYDILSGMTGTAETEAAELGRTYTIRTVTIPPNKPRIRVDHDPLVYATKQEKYDAVLRLIDEKRRHQQPVLVGTASVKASEDISVLLDERGIQHYTLNAKNNRKEALMVAIAGRLGAVTIATNMAGRGTDIVLGGNPDVIAEALLRHRKLTPESPEWGTEWDKEIVKQRTQAEHHADAVRNVGGLCVIATELHEARRIDNQLKGRSGRQGDPGETYTLLSLEDSILDRYMMRPVTKMRDRYQNAHGALTDRDPLDLLREAQYNLESMNFEIRSSVLDYDDVKNEQRKTLYTLRSDILHEDDMTGRTAALIDEVVHGVCEDILPQAGKNVEQLDEALHDLYGNARPVMDHVMRNEYGESGMISHRQLDVAVRVDALDFYDTLCATIDGTQGPGHANVRAKNILLSTIDEQWQSYLYVLDDVQEGIGLRTMAMSDPLVEFKRESYRLYGDLVKTMRREAVKRLLNPAFDIEQHNMSVQSRPMP